jgi:hypothetical protein
MTRSLTVVSFVLLIAAIAAWVGVWFMFMDISSRLTDRSTALSTLSSQSSKQSSAIAVHALVSDTTSQRQQLDADVSADVVGIANQINAASQSAGVHTTIGSASVITTSAAAGVNELEFVVQASGTFQQVWRAAQLFQTLPLASQVSQLDFEQMPSSGKGPAQWQLTADIDVLTSAQVSS